MKKIVMISLLMLVILTSCNKFEETFSFTELLELNSGEIETLIVQSSSSDVSITGKEDVTSIIVEATITTWNKENVVFSLEKDGNKAVLETGFDNHVLSFNQSMEVSITVPLDTNLEVDDSSRGLEIEDIHGNVTVEDNSGDITITRVQGELKVDDQSGDIKIIKSSNVKEILDGSGDMKIANSGGEAQIDDGSGDIDINTFDGDLDINDGSGDLKIHDINGNISITDGSGEINIKNVNGDLAILDDGSGNVLMENIEGSVTQQ